MVSGYIQFLLSGRDLDLILSGNRSFEAYLEMRESERFKLSQHSNREVVLRSPTVEIESTFWIRDYSKTPSRALTCGLAQLSPSALFLGRGS